MDIEKVKRLAEFDTPTVVIDGMTVKPGDVIHADANGVVAVPAGVADRVYDGAKQVQEKEAELYSRLRAPDMTIERWLESR